MRKIIAALQMSVDSFIEGPNGEMDWAMAEDEETWRELDETLNSVDTFILGRRMYPEYEQYWLSLLANPSKGTENENAYARRADKIPHIILSKTLDKVAWKTTRIVYDVRNPKNEATTWQGYAGPRGCHFNIQSNESRLDRRVHLMINPLILGGGKALFKDVKERHAWKLIRAKPLKLGKVSLIYNTQS
jgi:dihydrofolate reductase